MPTDLDTADLLIDALQGRRITAVLCPAGEQVSEFDHVTLVLDNGTAVTLCGVPSIDCGDVFARLTTGIADEG